MKFGSSLVPISFLSELRPFGTVFFGLKMIFSSLIEGLLFKYKLLAV